MPKPFVRYIFHNKRSVYISHIVNLIKILKKKKICMVYYFVLLYFIKTIHTQVKQINDVKHRERHLFQYWSLFPWICGQCVIRVEVRKWRVALPLLKICIPRQNKKRYKYIKKVGIYLYEYMHFPIVILVLKTMFSSSFPPVFCRAHVLFT